ncbi:CcoQ/FixQ family Cbb3-type cytochrome c oxidase assembly chaperone [Aquimarina sp. MMG015]|uniref:cytochrome c oxidase subunit IV n=1 Tax=Aquimarina TaxID=290174 RepID=UPI0004810505|nr:MULTISPECIES: cytochrome c oxidase subunit IV [Aquimarina]AXT58201.1 CcoQ/FixQ family Cbb3-type cytochrome c oxidase assembly chaperone [Aquimarina sp. AD1]MBQ4804974.1 CcoQ/FixQ family Cbb3-type cytochrome c oxidase assembly chaperone [Aquimarina sp. MMG015]RKN28066.1 CcoQ/FixQ family Cbb3-type cytochrome c oxidase assembly chaperone [Aquimarina sp. AD1]
MFKFIKGHMESIEGVEIYPIISLLIFFIFFTALFWWVISAKKEHIKEVSEIPLESENENELIL